VVALADPRDTLADPREGLEDPREALEEIREAMGALKEASEDQVEDLTVGVVDSIHMLDPQEDQLWVAFFREGNPPRIK